MSPPIDMLPPTGLVEGLLWFFVGGVKDGWGHVAELATEYRV